MSTRNDRDSAISIFLPLRPPTLTFRPRGWRSRNSTKVATPARKPPVAASTGAGSETIR